MHGPELRGAWFLQSWEPCGPDMSIVSCPNTDAVQSAFGPDTYPYDHFNPLAAADLVLARAGQTERFRVASCHRDVSVRFSSYLGIGARHGKWGKRPFTCGVFSTTVCSFAFDCPCLGRYPFRHDESVVLHPWLLSQQLQAGSRTASLMITSYGCFDEGNEHESTIIITQSWR